jgi:hypothetical protein
MHGGDLRNHFVVEIVDKTKNPTLSKTTGLLKGEGCWKCSRTLHCRQQEEAPDDGAN